MVELVAHLNSAFLVIYTSVIYLSFGCFHPGEEKLTTEAKVLLRKILATGLLVIKGDFLILHPAEGVIRGLGVIIAGIAFYLFHKGKGSGPPEGAWLIIMLQGT